MAENSHDHDSFMASNLDVEAICYDVPMSNLEIKTYGLGPSGKISSVAAAKDGTTSIPHDTPDAPHIRNMAHPRNLPDGWNNDHDSFMASDLDVEAMWYDVMLNLETEIYGQKPSRETPNIAAAKDGTTSTLYDTSDAPQSQNLAHHRNLPDGWNNDHDSFVVQDLNVETMWYDAPMLNLETKTYGPKPSGEISSIAAAKDGTTSIPYDTSDAPQSQNLAHPKNLPDGWNNDHILHVSTVSGLCRQICESFL